MIGALDLNCDTGESYGNYRIGLDEEIMPYLSSTNIACGFHAGDPVIMERTIALAKQYGVSVGVHWGLPDVLGFGRRRMDISPADARCITIYQIGALKGFADAAGVEVDHLVPHGALFSMLADSEPLAKAVISGITAITRKWVLYWPTPLQRHRFYELAQQEGLVIVPELAVDLHYRADGSLVLERAKQRWDPSEVADRIERFVECGKLRTVDGTDLEFEAKALLLHGDGPNALDIAKAIRGTLSRLGVQICPASTLAMAA